MEPINLLSPKFNGDAVEHSEHSGSAPVRKSTNLTFSNLILTEGDDAPKYGNKLLLTGELFYNREIIIDQEKQTITLKGIVRQKDIDATNTVSSSAIADAQITYTGAGALSQATKKGWLGKVIDVIWPF